MFCLLSLKFYLPTKTLGFNGNFRIVFFDFQYLGRVLKTKTQKIYSLYIMKL